MNDAIALLAISQLICLGGIVYLYGQVQSLRRSAPVRRARSNRVQALPEATHIAAREAANVAARHAYGAPAPRSAPRPALAAKARGFGAATPSLAIRANEAGVDVTAIARRMQKSEEEVRLLLRRQGIAS